MKIARVYKQVREDVWLPWKQLHFKYQPDIFSLNYTYFLILVPIRLHQPVAMIGYYCKWTDYQKSLYKYSVLLQEKLCVTSRIMTA